MIALLLDIYVLFVWLIFFRFKLLAFDLKAKITVGVAGVLFVFGILIALNFLHPMTMDARVVEYVVPVAAKVPQPARVTAVPVRPNVPVKKGELLFRVDARPYELEVARLKAAVAEAEQTIPQRKAAYASAASAAARAKAQRDLAAENFERDAKLIAQRAISPQEFDTSRRSRDAGEASWQAAQSTEEQARLGVPIEEQMLVQARAQLAKAEIDLQETAVYAPADGFVTALELRPGDVVAPGQAVMSFVGEPSGIVAATFPQEYLGTIAPGNEVEVALDMYPGRMLPGTVEDVIWATGQGQLTPGGVLPTMEKAAPHGRFAVKVRLAPEVVQNYRLPPGAGGAAAVYTDHGTAFRVVRRVVARWYTWLNYVKIST